MPARGLRVTIYVMPVGKFSFQLGQVLLVLDSHCSLAFGMDLCS